MVFSDSQKNEYMRLALDQARQAFSHGDVPVGAIIVDKEGKIIASSFNEREAMHDSTAHAEILCIKKACEALGTWRLSGCSMFVTVEPCPMCSGGLINSRIENVYIGVKNSKSGAFGSVLNMNSYPLNHVCRTDFGILQDECAELMQSFFKMKRCIEN